MTGGPRGLLRAAGEAVQRRTGRLASRVGEATPTPVDLLESDSAYLVVADAPGAAPGDVQVRYEDGRVEIRAERFRERHEGFEMRYPGRPLRRDASVALPADAVVDPTAASARLAGDGTLTVTLPRAEGPDGGTAVPVADGEDTDPGAGDDAGNGDAAEELGDHDDGD